MCGISGIVHLGSPDLPAYAAAMSDTLAHRGPDDAGVESWLDHGVALAQRRLSIIDLSPLGRNPMSNEDASVWITYNGEVYNYREIRRELEACGHRFRSNTDTEVVIHAYEEWGDDHVHRLRGMFAYAIYDRRPQPSGHLYRLLLVRDRLGIKPLFYYQKGEVFLFASEIKALRGYPEIDVALDRSAIYDYLTYGYIPTPKTAYAHIRKLPPGNLLIWEGDAIQVRQYWDVNLGTTLPIKGVDEAIELVRERLRDAVQYHLVSDVPVGLFLSGGLDSSAVLALLSKAADHTIRSFSIGFDIPEHSETGFARLAADRFSTQHREQIVKSDSLLHVLPQIVSLYDEPFSDSSAIPTWRVSEFASHEVKVALSGDGGDEVFAGYRWYDLWMRRQALRQKIPAFARHKVLAPLGRYWPSKTRKQSWKHLFADMNADPLMMYAHLRELFSSYERDLLLKPDWKREFADYDPYWHFREYWRPDLDPITQAQYLDLKTYLPDDILTKVDRASMAASLELRPPLLDHMLVETVFQIPSSIRFFNMEKKFLLKQAVGSQLPPAILARGKKGFSAPLSSWVKSQNEWADRFLKQSPTLINRANLENIGRGSWGSKQWALLVLECWHRTLQPSSLLQMA